MQRLTPTSVRLQLVSPTKALPVRPGWLYEPKLDGCRVLLGKDGTVCQVRTRGGGLVQRNVPEAVASLERLEPEHLVLDAELVVLDESGHTDFDAACARLKSQHGPAAQVFVFDVLALEGEDLRARPLRERKRALAKVLGPGDQTLRPVHFVARRPMPTPAVVVWRVRVAERNPHTQPRRLSGGASGCRPTSSPGSPIPYDTGR